MAIMTMMLINIDNIADDGIDDAVDDATHDATHDAWLRLELRDCFRGMQLHFRMQGN